MQKLIDAARQNERADVVLLIAENPDAQRLLVSWRNLPRKVAKRKKEPATLAEAWDQLAFDIGEWTKISDVLTGQGRMLSAMLIANNLVYPDGTVNGHIEKYFETLVAAKIAKAK
jgi:hypothetical protein